MRSRLLRGVISILLVLGTGATTASHRDAVKAVAPGGQLVAHHHGPHAPCPPGSEVHCLACAAHSLFAPSPSLGSLSVPISVEADWAIAERGIRNAERPAESGRSPPDFLPIA